MRNGELKGESHEARKITTNRSELLFDKDMIGLAYLIQTVIGETPDVQEIPEIYHIKQGQFHMRMS